MKTLIHTGMGFLMGFLACVCILANEGGVSAERALFNLLGIWLLAAIAVEAYYFNGGEE